MITTQDIQPVINRFIAGTDIFPVSLKISADNVIEVSIDSPQGVSLSQCAALSDAIHAVFDSREEDFELTVSSAGLDQPLRVFQQYLKYIGKEVEIVLKSGKKLTATLSEATPEAISVQYAIIQKVEGKKRKQPVTLFATYLLTEIKSTKPIIKWKD
ncbi:MAG: ribosome assembly cofactor RimP [Prevotellaceae bacterium]|jgi:ribosome maturation factor RimP|nr:ribosome assembly cofactor RimP [Prevotellaceae bacterium]